MRFSFICASYNYADYIGDTIQSVINQDVDDWEFIVFDDGSSDNSVELIKKYCEKDSRVKLFTHENNQNKGLVSTLRAACALADGDWIVFVESDDILKPNYLSEKINALNSCPEAKLIFSGVDILSSKEVQENYVNIFNKRDECIKNDFNISVLIRENIIPTFSCVMIKKDLFMSLNFDSPISQNIDWWLWAQVLSNHKVLYVNKNLSVWRRHENSYITSIDTQKMYNFSHLIFSIVFKSKFKILPKILLETYLFFNSRLMLKFFGTPSKVIRSFCLNILYKLNDVKADLFYYSV